MKIFPPGNYAQAISCLVIIASDNREKKPAETQLSTIVLNYTLISAFSSLFA